MQHAIRVSQACKHFGAGRFALRGVDVDIQPGERVALIGASGSGKSTLLRAICGLETLDAAAGSVEVFGKCLQSSGTLSPKVRLLRQSVGIVFQQFNLVGRLPVLTNVLTGAASNLPVWRALTGAFPQELRARALDILCSVGLEEQAFQRASTLSGGQQQRAAVARVLLQRASILLADEPVASLDPESTRRVMDLLRDLNERHGITLLISLHDVSLARRYCNRVIALREGEKVFDGPAADLTPVILRHLYGAAAQDLMPEEGASSEADAAPKQVHAGTQSAQALAFMAT